MENKFTPIEAIPLPIEPPTLVEQQVKNRSEITNLQGELHQLMGRINEIKAELTDRWETDRQLGMTIHSDQAESSVA